MLEGNQNISTPTLKEQEIVSYVNKGYWGITDFWYLTLFRFDILQKDDNKILINKDNLVKIKGTYLYDFIVKDDNLLENIKKQHENKCFTLAQEIADQIATESNILYLKDDLIKKKFIKKPKLIEYCKQNFATLSLSSIGIAIFSFIVSLFASVAASTINLSTLTHLTPVVFILLLITFIYAFVKEITNNKFIKLKNADELIEKIKEHTKNSPIKPQSSQYSHYVSSLCAINKTSDIVKTHRSKWLPDRYIIDSPIKEVEVSSLAEHIQENDEILIQDEYQDIKNVKQNDLLTINSKE